MTRMMAAAGAGAISYATLSYICFDSASNATVPQPDTPGPYAIGDLLILTGTRDADATAIVSPGGLFADVANVADNALAVRTAAKIATTAGADAMPTFTNANRTSGFAFRGADPTSPILHAAAASFASAFSTTAPALNSGAAFAMPARVLLLLYTKSNAVATPPAGFTTLQYIRSGSTQNTLVCLSDTALSSFADATFTHGASLGTGVVAVAIRPAVA